MRRRNVFSLIDKLAQIEVLPAVARDGVAKLKLGALVNAAVAFRQADGDVDELILKLNQKLKPQGRVISYDPLQTSIPIKILRRLYRPFQSDRDWEWPFSKNKYYKFENAFEIIERRGVLGKTKYTAFINLLPLSEDKRVEIAKQWHRQDWERSLKDDHHMFSCMHLSMLMQKKN